MNNKILIIGTGISGIACANSLKATNQVWLLEKNKDVGGLSIEYSCKATDKCNYCGWCLVDDNVKEFNKNNNNINILKESFIKKAVREKGKFKISISNSSGKGKIINETFDSIILASGGLYFDAKIKARFGYKKYENVITGNDLEKNLRTYDFSKINEIAFIQCVGSRDESIKALYCSQVCCRYALRIINYILFKHPNIKITIFYMDMQTTGNDISKIYDNLKNNENVKFIRSIPAFLNEINKKIKVNFDDLNSGIIENKEFDLVVLSVGISPNPDNKVFSKLFGVNLNEWGFIDADDNGETNIKNIYAAGISSSPKSIKNSIINAKAVCGVINE